MHRVSSCTVPSPPNVDHSHRDVNAQMVTRLMVTRSRCRVVRVQINKADGNRAIEQQTQQTQQTQQKQQQQQNGGGETRVSSRPPDPADAILTDGTMVRIPNAPSLPSPPRLLEIYSRARLFCAGRTGGRAGGGEGRRDAI